MSRRTVTLVAAGALAAAAILAVQATTAQNTPAQQACASEPGGAANVRARAQALLAALGPELRQKAILPAGQAMAIKWSNLPVNMVPRNGVRFAEMDAAQQAAANALVAAAMSACGKRMFDEVRGADAVLNKIRPQQWDPGNYFVAFVGQPSETAPWMLQVTGHHLAYNIAYNGPEVSATPLFDGIEPVKYTLDGREYEPLAVQRNAMAALAASIAQAPGARLEGAFRDITRGATNQGDVNFPIAYPAGATGRGVPYTALDAQQQAAVRAAMDAWVQLPNEAISRPLMARYLSETALRETYVGFAGQTDLSAPGSYVRIDGPRLWIEFVVQAAASEQAGIHFHTIWRDKTADYGGAFKG